jgi:N utilization substance protein B
MPRTERIETRGRARALQALYAWDMRPGEPLDQVATQLWDDLGVSPEERAFASRLVRTSMEQGRAIDGALRDVTTNWRLERIGAIERSVLRMAGAELQRGETPTRVVIQEAVTLAERYGTAQSARFVNGVLDALARSMGRL